MGNSSTGVPFSGSPTRCQQVFLKSELPPTAYPIHCIAFRPDDAELYGRVIDVEMTLGLTSYDVKTITSVFAANLDTGTPVKVLSRKKIRLPDLLGAVSPGAFRLQFATDLPFTWVPQGNLVLDIIVWGNDNSDSAFIYPLDAQSSPGTSTARVLSFGGPTATSGKVIREAGIVACFGHRCTTSAYSTYGNGCPGTGNSGLVVPARARTHWLNNSLPASFMGDDRWQQQIDPVALPRGPTLLEALALRADEGEARTAATTFHYKVSVGLTSTTSATMSTTFSANVTDPMTVVYQGFLTVPPRDRTSDLGRFDYAIPFTTPFLYTPTVGKSLLLDVESFVAWLPMNRTLDVESGALASGAAVYGYPRSAATGAAGQYCVAIRFGIAAFGTSVPVLSAAGSPVINSTFDVVLRDARPNSVAVLCLGGSDQAWGPLRLPLDLSPLGAPGCSLLSSFDLGVPLSVSTIGETRFPLWLPNAASFLGLRLYNQIIVADAPANQLGAAFSNAGTALIGEF